MPCKVHLFDFDGTLTTRDTLLACEEIRNFGITPKVALLSHSTFGTDDTPTAGKMRDVLKCSSLATPSTAPPSK